MKTKLAGLFIWVGMVLISISFSNKAIGQDRETIIGKYLIDLHDYYGKEILRTLNLKLIDAAYDGNIQAYKDDTLKEYWLPQEILYNHLVDSKWQEDTYDTVINWDFDKPEFDTIIRKYRYTNYITFKSTYSKKNNKYQLEFTGLSFNYSMTFNNEYFGEFEQFYVSREDLTKTFGKKETTELFANCYKALLKSLNTDKTKTLYNKTILNVDLKLCIGGLILYDLSKKSFNAVTKGVGSIRDKISAFKTYELNTTYTTEELTKTEIRLDSIQMPDPNDPDAIQLLDTFLIYYFTPDGYNIFNLSFNWSYNDRRKIATADLSALSNVIPYNINKKIVRYFTFYWLKWKDAEKIFTPLEIQILKNAFYIALTDLTWFRPDGK